MSVSPVGFQEELTILSDPMPEVGIFGWRSPAWDTEREKFKIDGGGKTRRQHTTQGS